MNFIKLSFAVTFFSLVLSCTYSQKVTVGFLTDKFLEANDQEAGAAYDFLYANKNFEVTKLYFEDITSVDKLNPFNVIWFHYSDSTITNFEGLNTDILKKYIEDGGNMFLTLEAFRFINYLEIEPNPVEKRNKEAKDTGYGRMLGLHAFINHPVFEGLNGGAYIFKPVCDTVVRQLGYFEENQLLNGAVVAVDWDYIFLRENSKLILEYWAGKGKVLAVGAYTCLSQPNINRQHLELFLNNSLNYLAKNGNKNFPTYYWQYYTQEVHPYESDFRQRVERKSQPWETEKSEFVLLREKATDNFWDVAGQRILFMGKENGGIDEIWSHPFMAFKDYEAGIKFSERDSILWLKKKTTQIEVRPESFTRKYNFKTSELTEIITTSATDPTGVVHYLYNGDEPVNLFIKFKTNLRLMWPYSENVIKTLKCSYDVNLNGMLISNESGDFSSLIGSDKEPAFQIVGQFDNFPVTWDKGPNGETYANIGVIASDDFIVSGIFQFEVNPYDQFNMVFSASNINVEENINHYIESVSNTKNVIDASKKYYEQLLSESLNIVSPDSIFNEGYQWALIATDRFFVNTPGLGKSLVAGYSTTNTGWDGGHKISGRPGYAWYFGRDGQWSSFALLDYGDFEKVRSVLEMYRKFQDLNGKIYHEISTSGVVHYDAADATPLYIILAGKYLQHSGDVDFIKKSWQSIQKAIDFCFSTDTDGDHLIENTNVGHGWVEGGG
ncbi:MAG: hypothetical protein B6D61_12730, partial [Bacteroidetes bacterium 4484_249]